MVHGVELLLHPEEGEEDDEELAAQKEVMTQDERQEREKIISEIEVFCRQWIEENVVDEEITKKTLGQMMEFLGENPESGKLIEKITRTFDNRERFIERPAIKMLGGENEPVIWLLGWRNGEGTPIHDHGNSEAGVHILKGI